MIACSLVATACTSESPPMAAPAIDAAAIADVEQLNAYVAEAAAFDQAGADSQFPRGLEFSAGGAPGYSRYVFREHSEGVVPTLVEGPLGDQVRCLDSALPCSMDELVALHEVGGPIPDELELTAGELSELVEQLRSLRAFAVAHADVNDACAAGFVSDRIQTPNMGSHFYNPSWISDGFDPSRPEILLYARADGQLPDGPMGQCQGGVWSGDPMELVGTAFIIPPQVIGDDHPETFAGPLDNWHIHYNLCRGANSGRDTFVPRSECEAAGGSFSPALGWMIHAWVAPDHDNQLGVFGMWNDTITPRLEADAIRDSRQIRGSDFPPGARQALISDFAFGDDLVVRTGQALFFNNVDSVPHTVTGGTAADPDLGLVDSGLLDPGSNFGVRFSDPGVYSIFCNLHPDMAATVRVNG